MKLTKIQKHFQVWDKTNNPFYSEELSSQTVLIDSFISSQDLKESSKKLYREMIRKYFKWLSRKHLMLADVLSVDILNYKENLLEDGISPLTINTYISPINRFYEWTKTEKYSLSIEQCQSLINQLKNEVSLRDFTIINLLLRSRLTITELNRINIQDIVFKGDRRVLLLHGKCSYKKDSFLVLTEKRYKPIRKYLQSRDRLKAKEPLFVTVSNNNRDRRLTTHTISTIVKGALKGIGLDTREFTIYSLRDILALRSLKHEWDIEDTQSILWYSSPISTPESIKEEIDSIL